MYKPLSTQYVSVPDEPKGSPYAEYLDLVRGATAAVSFLFDNGKQGEAFGKGLRAFALKRGIKIRVSSSEAGTVITAWLLERPAPFSAPSKPAINAIAASPSTFDSKSESSWREKHNMREYNGRLYKFTLWEQLSYPERVKARERLRKRPEEEVIFGERWLDKSTVPPDYPKPIEADDNAEIGTNPRISFAGSILRATKDVS